MANFILRILPAVLFVAAAPAGCDEEPVAVDRSETAPVVEAATATAVLARGVTDYTVTREAAGAHVVLRGASELGDLTTQTVAPGVVRLQLDWQGRALEFEVDTTQVPAPLTIRAGGRTAVVHAEGADDPAARALFAEVQGEWELARAAFVELDLAPGLLAEVEQQLTGSDGFFTDDLTLSPRPAADNGCPNICHQNGCAWFWDQYCHTTPIGPGQCQVGFCGCGDC
ncbi:hypothetical protein OV090_15420 [Nannocystis sp. RBIL2]|uniref:hypothetical protein n=1 Tax=Nannocystis sp. RBIL2 TaxID=2996788 RepID=UPI0022719627|nr:hypothetical protein [Nannocystis sp. RBIL2]MCY1066168.1 hypothetical protein [Nannocystis sp. RBIL2]